jgi:hypothetical protein
MWYGRSGLTFDQRKALAVVMMYYFVIDGEGEVRQEVVDQFRAYTSHVRKHFGKDFGSRLDSNVADFAEAMRIELLFFFEF